MRLHFHQSLASGRWQQLSFVEQMANIGSEVERTIKWRKKSQLKFFYRAFDRAVELIDLTIDCHSHDVPKLKELLRTKECLIDDFIFDNSYGSTNESWQKYFLAFTYAT